MNEYRTIDIVPEEHTADPMYQTGAIVTDHGENIERMLLELIDIQRRQEKQIRSLRSYGAVVSLAAAIQIIIWILTVFGFVGFMSR